MNAAADRHPLVLHVTNIPTPYRIPYFRALGDVLGNAGLDLHIFFLGRGKRRREWKIAQDDLAGLDYTVNESEGRLAIGHIVREIRRLRPSVVVIAWAMDPLALRLLLHCRLRKIPVLLFTGETAHTASGRSYPAVRSVFRSIFFRLADWFLTYGTRSREYLIAGGVPPARITTGLNVVDTALFREKVESLRESGEAARWRDEHRMADGSPFTVHLLMVNYMIPGKGVSSTLRALKALGRDDVALHIVGSGPREEEHRAMAEREGLGDGVFFHGYRQTSELFIFYALADIFLFPSSIDIFGLVMVEASAAGLAVIASNYSGGTVDVIQEGVTGLIIDPRDRTEYVAALRRLIDDPELRAAMGAAGRLRTIETLTLERSASRYAEAISALIGPGGPYR
ncbi:MAG: glycosyltransferase family 4 protein [Candidatus Kapaibacterium sp.]